MLLMGILSMIGPDQVAKNNIGVMLGDLVVVGDLLDHVDVVLLAVLPELGLQHHEEVLALLVLQSDALGVGWHLALPDVDLPLDVAGAVVEHQHIAPGLPPERFQPPHYR